jgi:uncharacterized membrane protein YebE (DUF533 family)
MGIPIGREYTATMSASCTKAATCEKCAEDYLYKVEREATGSGSSILFLDNQGASQRAESAARKNLENALEKAVDAVPCPSCGWLQKNMVGQLKWSRANWVFWGLLVIGGGLLLYKLFSDTNFVEMHHWAILTGVSLSCGALIYFAYDPNTGYRMGHGHPKRALESRGVRLADLEAQDCQVDKALQSELYGCLRFAMLSMAGIDGVIDPDELEAISRIYEQVTDQPTSVSTLQVEARTALGKHCKMLEDLSKLTPYLQYDGKAMFIRAVLVIASADGVIDDSEWQLLAAIGGVLELNADQINEIIDEMASPVE